MTLRRREFLTGIAGAGLLAGCTQGSATRTQGTGVTMWSSFPSDAFRRYFEKNFLTAYNRHAPPGGKVTTTVKDSSTLERLQQTAIASGTGPTLIFTSGPSYALQYANAGKLAPLDAYADRYGWSAKVLPWAFDAGKVGGKLYSLPNSYEAMVTFYDRKTFDEYGWKPPTNREEFEDLCSDAAGRGLTPVSTGSADWPATTEWHVTVFLNHAAGPEAVYQALTGKLKWTDPVFVDAISLMYKYFQRGWFGGGVDRYFTNRTDAYYAALAGGKAAMTIVGTWAFSDLPPYFEKAPKEWDWAPLPSFSDHVPDAVYALGSGGTLSVNSDSKHADQAAAYLNWLYSDPGRQAKAVADVNMEPYPVHLSAADFPHNVDPRVQRFYVDVARSGHLGYTTWTFWPPRSDTYIYKKMDAVLTGKLSPADYCQGLDDIFSEERGLDRVPPAFRPAGAGS
ncbi:MAG TPA: extracellular solute-binding protein [Mycobacteriales bacterium]|nr:extracellular solute-binding protein [Mycobacteriales bacterium]